jgi:hypothetical protein
MTYQSVLKNDPYKDFSTSWPAGNEWIFITAWSAVGYHGVAIESCGSRTTVLYFVHSKSTNSIVF